MAKIDPKKLAKAAEPQGPHLTPKEIKILGIANSKGSDKISEPPYVALKYFSSTWECLSDWSAEELKALSAFLEKLGQYTWDNILKTGGALGAKRGLGYTPHGPGVKLPKTPNLQNISPDIATFELRVTQKARVHGFRVKSTFFLVWLDRGHRICPM